MPPWDRRPRSYYWFAGRAGGEKRGQAERARYRGGDVALKPDDAHHTMDMALVGLQSPPKTAALRSKSVSATARPRMTDAVLTLTPNG
jgi:hypothetical protein